MSFSTIALIQQLGEHMAADSGVTAAFGAGSVYHANAGDDEPMPILIYRMPALNLRDSQGLGTPQVAGQVVNTSIIFGVLNQADDPTGLGTLADAVDDAIRSWTPTGWAVRELQATAERTDSRVEEGFTIQSATMEYALILERA